MFGHMVCMVYMIRPDIYKEIHLGTNVIYIMYISISIYIYVLYMNAENNPYNSSYN